MDRINKKHWGACMNKLKEIGAPLYGWKCIDMFDAKGDEEDELSYATCDLCGNTNVRFVHVMKHDQWPEVFEVGCVCAGIMEGNIDAARDRERSMKNKKSRLKRFMTTHTWMPYKSGYRVDYKGKHAYLFKDFYNPGCFCLSYGRKYFRIYNGARVMDMNTALVYAFELFNS